MASVFDAWLGGTGDEFEHAETWLELPASV
jgi:hypothetical protein